LQLNCDSHRSDDKVLSFCFPIFFNVKITGQTRDVHIYRLITEHTIEENILSKAKQKKNLDIMVMDHGKFDAVSAKTKDSPKPVADDNIEDVYTKKGLQAILGVADDDPSGDSAPGGDSKGLSKEQMEIAMTALEDEDDVKALRGAQKEAADELKEFDENAEIQKNSEDEEDEAEGEAKKANEEPLNVENRKEMKITDTSKEPGNDDDVDQDELEREFAAWQSSEGFDGAGIENSLSPMERYGLHFHENIDPFYSIFLINEERRKMEGTEGDNDLDIEELERMKAMEERQAMEDGDLLATKTRPEDLVRQRNLYRREKTRLRSDKKRRRLKGEDWSQRVDGLTQKLFWYNEDTGEAVWDTPHIVTELREDDLAKKEGWSKLPLKPLVHIMDYLAPFPDRQSCSSVCRQWKIAGNDVQFVRHVYPVEMGALATESARRDHNHFVSISDALQVALPGDTIGKCVQFVCLIDMHSKGVTYYEFFFLFCQSYPTVTTMSANPGSLSINNSNLLAMRTIQLMSSSK
jgi:F-box-like